MARWPFGRGARREAKVSASKATVDAAAVKVEALALVAELRETLGRLDRVLQGEAEADQTEDVTGTDV